MMKKILVGVSVFAFALVAFGAKSEAAYMHTVTLKLGSTGSQVMSLQATLNATTCMVATSGAGSPGMETSTFAGKTKAAVQCFQAANGLTADGVVGPMTGAKLAMVTGGPITAGPCPAGYTCTPSGGTPSTPSTGLSGGAGDLDLSETTTDVEDTVKEGEDDVKIFGVKAEADGSDIAITSVKVTFTNNDTGSSENFEKYIDSVSVWLGDTQVGSADADEFSKDSGSQDEFSKTISLSGAVIDEDDEAKLYVAVSAISSIDSDDMDTADWDIKLDTVRFNDATGAILTGDVSDFDAYSDNDSFSFEDVSTDDKIDLKSDSANPDDVSVKVDENDESDEFLALAFKLDVDEDSSDVSITNLPIAFEVENGGTDADSIENIIDKVTVKVGSDSWEADLEDNGTTDDGGLNTSGETDVSNEVHYSVDFDDDEFTIDAGDVAEVKVYVTFKEQDDNYDTGTIVTASVANEAISAETSDDELDVDGSDQTGAALTLDTSVATISNIDWDIPSKGTIIDFLFTVEAEDDDVSVVIADITANDSTSGTATVGTPTVTRISGDASGSVDNYTVADGDTARFRVRYAITGSDGDFANVTITSVVGQEVPDDDQVSPTATLDIN